MWLVDTGCGYDLVSKRAVALMKRFVEKATHTITFHTAHGPTVVEDVANVYVNELDENITPYIFNNSPPVLKVGYSCMEFGYTFIWPTGQNPYFIRIDGRIVHLTVDNCIPYLVPNSNRCKPCKPTGPMPFRCATPVISRRNSKSGGPGVAAHAHRPKARTNTKKCRVERFAVPSDTESGTDVPDLVESAEDASGQSSSGDESIDRMSRSARRSLREETHSLYHFAYSQAQAPIL